MKTVLLVATTTGYQIRSFGEAAQALGVKLVFVSDRCDQLDDPWWDHAIPVKFHDAARSTAAVLASLGDLRPDGVLAVGDRPTVLAAHLASVYRLPGHSPEAAERSRNKLAAREAFRAAGLPTPEFFDAAIDADPHAVAARCAYPVVLKPLALSGSRGVMRVNGAEEFVAAFARLRRLLQSRDVLLEREAPHDRALIESFVPGREFAIEGVLTGGRFTPFAIFDKPDPLDGPFFEETIYVTPSRASGRVQAAIADSVAAAARALGLHHGPVHAECRVNDSGVYVLEVAARPIGGLCSRALRFACGDPSRVGGIARSLEEVLLRHAVGDDIADVQRETGASAVMMIPIPVRGVFRRVDGVDAAAAVPHVEDVRITAKPDAVLTPLPEGRSYLGFIFARAERAEAAERALREAHARLRIVVDRELPVV